MLIKKQSIEIVITITLLIMFVVSCSGGEMEEKKVMYSSLDTVPEEAWDKLSKKTFYFGHQSVGFNIMDGVGDLMAQYPQIQFKIIETHDPESMKPGIFAHSPVGKNREPKSKVDDFIGILKSGVGQSVNVAALKLCYVDIAEDANPTDLFSSYAAEVKKIRQLYPNLTIIHFTVPLTTLQTGPKSWIKKIIGRPVYGVRENIKRQEYNELLRAQYKGKEPVLDIAEIESTYPDGTRSNFTIDGKTYHSLVTEYTDDGGHLNEVGRKKVAEQLILLMTNLQ